MGRLGVNIDHVATIRQARQTYEPDPVWAAALAELGGADGITIHLREDRRHIKDRDLRLLRETVSVKLNLELACNEDVVQKALEVKPDQATIVPENRHEITTEGGLDVAENREAVERTIKQLRGADIEVSLFLDPDEDQIRLAKELGAQAVELHTGQYAMAKGGQQEIQLQELEKAGREVLNLGLTLHAGHGLTYQNVRPIAQIPQVAELNIGHSIVSRAVFVGIERAVREMKDLIS